MAASMPGPASGSQPQVLGSEPTGSADTDAQLQSVADAMWQAGTSLRASSAAATQPSKCKTRTKILGLGTFASYVKLYSQVDLKEKFLALERADPKRWNAQTAARLSLLDVDYNFAVAFQRFPHSELETRDISCWHKLMAQQYKTFGCPLQGKSKEEVWKLGKALIASPHMLDLGQAGVTLAIRDSAAGASEFAPALMRDPHGRSFVKAWGRSRYLRCLGDGGADDWVLADGTLQSSAQGLTIHVLDLLQSSQVHSPWPSGPGPSTTCASAGLGPAPWAGPGPVTEDPTTGKRAAPQLQCHSGFISAPPKRSR